MYTDLEDLVHEIYSRHLRSLAIAGGKSDSLSVPVASVRLVLHLALSELAERLPVHLAVAVLAEPQPEPLPAAVMSAPAAAVTVGIDSEPQPKKRLGRPPKANYERRQRKGLADDIAAHVANGAQLVVGDPDVALEGTLRREETVTRHVNGVPTAVTRQYIELR